MPAQFDPTAVDYQSILATEHDIIAERQWQPDNPPSMLERYRKNVIPVQSTPSDRITFQTVTATLGKSTRIIGRQAEGVACRLHLLLTSILFDGDAGIALVISTAPDPIVTRSAVAGSTTYACANGLVFDNVPTADLVLDTRSEIYMSCLTANPALPASVGIISMPIILESYDLASG